MPAYSLSKEKKTTSYLQKNINPGVGSYNVQRRSQDSTMIRSPSYKIGQSKKLKTQGFGPSPASYETEKNSFFEDKKRGFTMTANRKERISTQGPGPSYYPNLIHQTQKYSFGIKLKEKDLAEGFPGPTSYSPKSSHRIISIKIGNDSRMKNKTNKHPGPGAYNLQEKDKESHRSYSFNKSPRRKPKQQEQMKNSPSPTTYNTNFNILKKRAIASKFAQSRRQSSGNSNIPGVGLYSIQNTCKNRSPVATFGNSPRQSSRQSKGPGPNNYNLISVDKIFKNQPKVKFGKQKRDYQNALDSPGPGAYDIKLRQTRKSFTIARKKEAEAEGESPGPQNYSPRYECFLTKSPNIIIGSEKRLNSKKQLTPGPAEYMYSTSRGKTFYFPKETKHNTFNTNPGPGSYQIKSFFDLQQKQSIFRASCGFQRKI